MLHKCLTILVKQILTRHFGKPLHPSMCNISRHPVNTPLWEDGIAFQSVSTAAPLSLLGRGLDGTTQCWDTLLSNVCLLPLLEVIWWWPSCPSWSLWPRGTLIRSLCLSQCCRFLFYTIAFFSFSNEKELLDSFLFLFWFAAEALLAETSTWKPDVDCMIKALIWVRNLYIWQLPSTCQQS